MSATYADQRAHDATWMTAAERADADLRTHLLEAHVRYVAGVDLGAMTRAELITEHDDMPARYASCKGFPARYAAR